MKKLILLSILFSSHLALAVCAETDSGKDTAQKGITKWVMKSTCTGKEKNCRTIASYEKDYCLNDKTLVEFYCDKSVVKQEQVACPSGCAKSRCQ